METWAALLKLFAHGQVNYLLNAEEVEHKSIAGLGEEPQGIPS